MADKVLSANRSELGHSFLNAMWIAGFLATLQIVAVATAVIKRSPPPDQPVVTTTPPVMRIPPDTEVIPIAAPSILPVATEHAGTKIPDLPEVKSSPKGVGSSGLVRPMRAPDLSGITDPVSMITDSLLARLVESGVYDRKRGDLKSALDAFLDANENLPEHPRILSEIAGTYGEMGKLDMATDYWTQVARMGKIVAGPYHKIATRVLQGEDPSIPDIEAGKFLKVGKVEVRKQPVSNEGERVSLLIPIVGKSGETISGGGMDLRVYFYDLINRTTPGQTTATISYDFPSQPYNWLENRTEEVEVIYHQPVFTLEQKQNLGERVYFGYVIELYYQNQLQDSVVSSEELRSLRFPVSEPVEEPLPPQGPDTSLFPINR